jgi:hypothetical protein
VPETRSGLWERLPEAAQGRVNTTEMPPSNTIHRGRAANPQEIRYAIAKFNKFLARLRSMLHPTGRTWVPAIPWQCSSSVG